MNRSAWKATRDALRAELERERRREVEGGYMSQPRKRLALQDALDRVDPGWKRRKW